MSLIIIIMGQFTSHELEFANYGRNKLTYTHPKVAVA